MLKHRANFIVATGIVWTVVSALCFGTSASAGNGLIVGPQRVVLMPGHTHISQLVGNPGNRKVCAGFVPTIEVSASPMYVCLKPYTEQTIRLTLTPLATSSSVTALWQVRLPKSATGGSGLNVIARVGTVIVTNPGAYIAEHTPAIKATRSIPWLWLLFASGCLLFIVWVGTRKNTPKPTVKIRNTGRMGF